MRRNGPYRICSRCVMDTSDPEIRFDEQGVCNHCSAAIKRMKRQLLPPYQRAEALKHLSESIKADGKNKEYDCVIGVSGGIDSSFVAYEIKKLGLRPLAVHFDNGWNSELAVSNITKILDALEIELHTHVVDWEEFRDLQLSFLKASVVNVEIPTDHAINALLFKIAAQRDIRFILSGSNLSTEAIMPYAWAHYNQDFKHLKAVHKQFGSRPLLTMPTISISDYFHYVFGKKILQIPFLNYVEYDKEKAKERLGMEIGWRDYGGKHYESIWTRFFQGYFLPTKFGIDKRRAHLSTLICSGQIGRQEALDELARPAYDEKLLKEDYRFVIKKFGLKKAEFEEIMNLTPKEHREYPSNYFLFHKMGTLKNVFRYIATGRGKFKSCEQKNLLPFRY